MFRVRLFQNGRRYWEMFDAHCGWVCKDTNSSEQCYNLLWEIEGKTGGSKFLRRRLGCQSILLNEDETSLLAEISYYQQTQKLLSSVTRNNINHLFE
jgi:hypothetical protein